MMKGDHDRGRSIPDRVSNCSVSLFKPSVDGDDRLTLLIRFKAIVEDRART
jgi:hypothetical protein